MSIGSRYVILFSLLAGLLLSLAAFTIQASPLEDSSIGQVDSGPVEVPPGKRAPDLEIEEKLVDESENSRVKALDKIDPDLQEQAIQGGKEIVDLYVSVENNVDLGRYLKNMIVRPQVFGGIRQVYGQTEAGNLLNIAMEPGVIALVQIGAKITKPDIPRIGDLPDAAFMQERMNSLRANEFTYTQARSVQESAEIAGWFDVLDGHQSSAAWKKGFTGKGVVVGVLDDGIDFAHPDLQGTFAVVADPESPYFGWPMAFSQVSAYNFVLEVYFQDAGATGITSQAPGTRWSDTQMSLTPVDNQVSFRPLGSAEVFSYTVPPTSESNVFKIGSHPDQNLSSFYYGHKVAVLVVDENTAGVYDTVYVDLDNDKDFTDEKPVTKDSPEIYRDMDGDGFADISGGLLVWISDGANPPPVVDWMWGVTCGVEVGTLKACPGSGDLLLFTGPLDAEVNGSHGTMVGSNIAAKGVISGGLSAQPFRQGGMVQGAAPGVGLMDFSNHYYAGSNEDEYLVAALGYDGIPQSGDEVQIVSNSYGNTSMLWGGWGYYGRLITALNKTIAPSTVWVFAVGNFGPGYGPQEADGGPTILSVSSSTEFGSVNWDSITGIDQVMYGDPSSYASHGPNMDGSAGVDVLANGGHGTGDLNLNYLLDGASAYWTWSGTSRSVPVAAGNLALIFQAYKDRYGKWPAWDVAHALLKSGATNAVSSPFFQGAGVVNSDRSTDLAAGIYGVYATPDEWQVGDWEGVEYLNFARVAYPGESYVKTYTVNNPSGYDIDVDLADGVMTLISSHELSFTTSQVNEESSFNFNSPDYLLELDDSLIPPDAEVMIVRYVHSYDSFDPELKFQNNQRNGWVYLLYNWTDVNGDGKLWEDRNGNGVVNHADDVAAGMDNDGYYRPDYITTTTEIQQGEYMRMDFFFGGLANPIIIKNPLERMSDGYFFGWQHRPGSITTVPTTTFKIGLEFYRRADWDWLSLSETTLNVPAEGSANFNATMNVPLDAAPGVYEGVIFIQDPGDMWHEPYETALPIVANVIADLPDGGSVTLGGGPLQDTMYQNSHTFGYFNWYGNGMTGAGDWRHYFLNVDAADLEAENLLLHTSWENFPTDINTWLLGPSSDCASNGMGDCATFGMGWYSAFDIGQPDVDTFGPYTLRPIGWSDAFVGDSVYPFHTSTGGPDDWLMVPLEQAGLHEVALHNVLYAGLDTVEQFQVDVGTIHMDMLMDPSQGVVWEGSIKANTFVDSGEIELQFTSSIELPDLELTLAGGLASTQFGPFTSFVPDNGNCFDAWCEDNVFEEVIVGENVSSLQVHLIMKEGQDADLFLVYDLDDNGLLDENNDPVVASAAHMAGEDEDFILPNPPAGRYWVDIAGYDMEPNAGVDLDWWYAITKPGAMPTDPIEVFSDTVSIEQDVPDQPTTASYSMTVMAGQRAAALNVKVDGIPAGANVDVYVTGAGGAVLASSTNTGSAGEMAVLLPPDGNYRFETGSEYTLWVLGAEIPSSPISPHLDVWWDQHNFWLSDNNPDVKTRSIGGGQVVSATLHFDKAGWTPGDPALSARLIAGPSVLPGAFDELVTLFRTEPVQPEWDPSNLAISIQSESSRGPSPIRYWPVQLVDVPTTLVAAGELVTYTVRVENLDPEFGTPGLVVDASPLPDDFICGLFGLCDDQVNGAAYGLIDGSAGTEDYSGGIWWTGVISPGRSVEFRYWVQMTDTMEIGQNHTSGVIVYDNDWNPYGWAVAGGYALGAEDGLTGSKSSTPAPVLPGNVLTYTIHLENPSAEDRAVYIIDQLPDEVSYLSHTGNAVYLPVTHTIYWEGLLPGNVTTEVDFQVAVQAAADLPFNSFITNQAQVGLAGTATPVLFLTDINQIGTGANLEIEKKVDALFGTWGDRLEYSINFQNMGVQEGAKNVVMIDRVPAFLEVLTGTIQASKASTGDLYDGENITWQGDLASGEQVTIVFDANIHQAAPEGLALINPAQVSAENYPWLVYDSALTEVLAISRLYLPLVVRQ